jgi:hypothetical protein
MGPGFQLFWRMTEIAVDSLLEKDVAGPMDQLREGLNTTSLRHFYAFFIHGLIQ